MYNKSLDERQKILSAYNVFVVPLIWLASMSFLNKTYYLLLFAFLLLLFLKNVVCIDKNVIMLFILSSCFIVTNIIAGASFVTMIKQFAFPICYMIGYSFVKGSKNRTSGYEKKAIVLFSSIALGALVHYILNWSTNFDVNTSRNTIDFWTKEQMAATCQAALCYALLALAIATLFCNTKLVYKIMAIVSLLVIFGYNLILAGRTLVFLAIILMVLATLFDLINGNKKSYRTVIIILSIIALALVVYYTNLFGVKSLIEKSNLFNREMFESFESLLEDTRLDRKLLYLQHFLDYPFGGGHLNDMYGHAHDIFLDTYDRDGIIALIVTVFFVIASLVQLFKFVRNKKHSFDLRRIVLCIYISAYVIFFVEPIQGVPWVFSSFCMVHGAVAALQSTVE